MLGFVSQHGYLEAMVRGFRCNVLTSSNYATLTSSCETVDDLRVQLSATPLGDSLKSIDPHSQSNNNNNGSAMSARQLWATWQRITLVQPFRYMQANAEGSLKRLLELLTHMYMIDNVVLVLTNTAHQHTKGEDDADGEKAVDAVLENCHPLGKFDVLGALGALQVLAPANTSGGDSVHVYSSILLESPLRPYFEQSAALLGGVEELAALDADFLRAILGRVHLEALAIFFASHDGDVDDNGALEMLWWEADRRAINLCLHGIMRAGAGTGGLGRSLSALFPRIPGSPLYPFVDRLCRIDDVATLTSVLDMVPQYRSLTNVLRQLLEEATSTAASPTHLVDNANVPRSESVEDFFYGLILQSARKTFERPHSFGVFYGWLAMVEQELRNVRWLADCLAQRRKDKLSQIIH